MPERATGPRVMQCVVVLALRERARSFAREAFPRRRFRVTLTRDASEFAASFHSGLVDAAVVDVGAGTDEAWRAAALAREFPSTAFFGVMPLRATDSGTMARCASLDFIDILAEGIDDGAAREIVAPSGFSSRFADALREPPASLGLARDVQRETWRCIVAYAGRALRTDLLAESLGMTREHLSRTFAQEGAPNLKRVIDLVRLIAAAELSKNPGYDVGDVSRVLGFASSSHLSSTAQRVVGTRPASLARLRTVDLIERFAQGRARSRE